MRPWLTPARRRGVEILDDAATPEDVRARAMDDVARSNRLFGGTRAVVRALGSLVGPGRPAIVLDVGTGTGDIPERIAGDATTIGLDVSESVLRAARRRTDLVVAGNALALPLRNGCVDIVICSQLLHHFAARDAVALVRELHRVSRRWVVVSDIRRSWFAAAGFWLASTVLRLHPVTRHDGVVSVFRGFTTDELRRVVREASGVEPRVSRRAFWRLTAVWETSAPDAPGGYT